MKQLFQNLKTGVTELVTCPHPQCRPGAVIIQSKASVVSLGTEKMLVEFGKSNLLQKAKKQPEKVKQVLGKIKTDGLLQTVGTVLERLDEPLPLGYCNAGVVVETGKNVTGIKVGDRVVSNGPHAETVMVAENLVAKIPDGVSFEHAAFTVVGSIGLQGLRLAAPTLGETVVVIGLGLIGQLTAQLALAQGCRVLAFDIDVNKVQCAVQFGIEAQVSANPVVTVQLLTHDVGADCVLITASSSSEAIIGQAAGMCRKRGRIVLVGVIPLSIKRADFYEKELSFQVSCSYGPGRYDPAYEVQGHDYPLPFVRWTEKRNFEAVLQCIAGGRINLQPLITATVPFEKTPSLYDKLGDKKSIASVIVYECTNCEQSNQTIVTAKTLLPSKGGGVVAVIGTGNFTKMAMLPAFKKVEMPVKYLCSQSGTAAAYLARKYSIPLCTTNTDEVLNDTDVLSVVIATRHKSHAALVISALEKGKHVFVEKPLAVDREQLTMLAEYCSRQNSARRSLLVGFNRRYSPLVTKVKEYLKKNAAQFSMVYTMNAGAIPKSHWLQSAEEGGRIIGEACHCIDLFVHFAGSQVVEVNASAMGTDPDALSDTVSILCKTANGCHGVINYFSNGGKAYKKEQVTLFAGNAVLEIDNFKKLRSYGCNAGTVLLMAPDKGHTKQFEVYRKFLAGEELMWNTTEEHLNVTEAAIAAVESLSAKKWLPVTQYAS